MFGRLVASTKRDSLLRFLLLLWLHDRYSFELPLPTQNNVELQMNTS
jgi:hypothetical protein